MAVFFFSFWWFYFKNVFFFRFKKSRLPALPGRDKVQCLLSVHQRAPLKTEILWYTQSHSIDISALLPQINRLGNATGQKKTTTIPPLCTHCHLCQKYSVLPAFLFFIMRQITRCDMLTSTWHMVCMRCTRCKHNVHNAQMVYMVLTVRTDNISASSPYALVVLGVRECGGAVWIFLRCRAWGSGGWEYVGHVGGCSGVEVCFCTVALGHCPNMSSTRHGPLLTRHTWKEDGKLVQAGLAKLVGAWEL